MTTANWKWEGGLPPVPSVEHYVRALSALRDSISAGQLAMLAAQYAAPDQTITATQLAQAAGYANWRGANLQYGRLAATLCRELGYDYQRWGILPAYSLSYFIAPDGIDILEWQLVMQPHLTAALTQLAWFPSLPDTEQLWVFIPDDTRSRHRSYAGSASAMSVSLRSA